MKVKLRDKTWSVIRADLGPSVRGQIDPPTYARKQLKMSTRIKKNQEFLEVFIHECLHGCFWDIDEEAIDRTAADIAKALYRLGARVDPTKIGKSHKKRG